MSRVNSPWSFRSVPSGRSGPFKCMSCAKTLEGRNRFPGFFQELKGGRYRRECHPRRAKIGVGREKPPGGRRNCHSRHLPTESNRHASDRNQSSRARIGDGPGFHSVTSSALKSVPASAREYPAKSGNFSSKTRPPPRVGGLSPSGSAFGRGGNRQFF